MSLLATITAYAYPIALILLSAGVAFAESRFPWRPAQPRWRRALGSDLLHLAFNGHFLGVILFGVAVHRLLPTLDGWLARAGLTDHVYRNAASHWPLYVQIPVALVAVDFVQWCVHRLLHRVPFLWQFHQTHHSIVDGEMDWIVSFRFQWAEVVVYRAVLYLPLAFFGFATAAVLFHAIVGTLVGHLNHANLDLGHGRWRYVLNSPRMHIWHHDRDGDERTTVNFGIIFSAWDWIFGTARMPDHPPARLGFPGVERFPTHFLSQAAWPVQRVFHRPADGVLAIGVGYLLLAGGWWLHEPLRPRVVSAGVFAAGERASSSQPSGARAESAPRSIEEATAALERFGAEARASGYAHPEAMVSTGELTQALGSPRLSLFDVRPAERFATGHIPGARRVGREEYAARAPIPGLSVAPERLVEILRARGVNNDSVIVLYSDGGPEPYRLWWALRALLGVEARVLDGGLAVWKANQRPLAEGEPDAAVTGDLEIAPPSPSQPLLWEQIAPLVRAPGAVLIDARSTAEFIGADRHEDASRAGHIPGAAHLEWTELLRGAADPRLRPAGELWALFRRVGVGVDSRVITQCQSGTRSAVTYFALHQLGFADDHIANYNGSWAEYSRLDLPLETTVADGPATP